MSGLEIFNKASSDCEEVDGTSESKEVVYSRMSDVDKFVAARGGVLSMEVMRSNILKEQSKSGENGRGGVLAMEVMRSNMLKRAVTVRRERRDVQVSTVEQNCVEICVHAPPHPLSSTIKNKGKN